MRQAAGKNCETWYFYNVLVPRVFTNISVSQYRRDKAALEELRKHCTRTFSPAESGSPPAPSDVAQPFATSAVDVGCDSRWGPSPDGRCDYIPTRGVEYEIHLRTHAPDFFAALHASESSTSRGA